MKRYWWLVLLGVVLASSGCVAAKVKGKTIDAVSIGTTTIPADFGDRASRMVFGFRSVDGVVDYDRVWVGGRDRWYTWPQIVAALEMYDDVAAGKATLRKAQWMTDCCGHTDTEAQ